MGALPAPPSRAAGTWLAQRLLPAAALLPASTHLIQGVALGGGDAAGWGRCGQGGSSVSARSRWLGCQVRWPSGPRARPARPLTQGWSPQRVQAQARAWGQPPRPSWRRGQPPSSRACPRPPPRAPSRRAGRRRPGPGPGPAGRPVGSRMVSVRVPQRDGGAGRSRRAERGGPNRKPLSGGGGGASACSPGRLRQPHLHADGQQGRQQRGGQQGAHGCGWPGSLRAGVTTAVLGGQGASRACETLKCLKCSAGQRTGAVEKAARRSSVSALCVTTAQRASAAATALSWAVDDACEHPLPSPSPKRRA